MEICFACRMHQHQDCPTHFIEEGKSGTCECAVCAQKRDSHPSPPPEVMTFEVEKTDANCRETPRLPP